MSCDPFEKPDAMIQDYNWCNILNKTITLKDNPSYTYVAKYMHSDYVFSVFNVETKKGESVKLLPLEFEKLNCDFLLLKCPIKTQANGVAYFIECKSNSSRDHGLDQLRESFTRLNDKYPSWMESYPKWYFRLTYNYRKNQNVPNLNSEAFIKLRALIPFGILLSEGIIVRNFNELNSHDLIT